MLRLYTFALILLSTGFTISAQQLVTGKATLEKIDKRVYTISKMDGISKTLDLDSENKNNIKGVLAVLFDDCSDIRDEIFATEYFDEKTLTRYTNSYNNCDYSSYTPTKKELKRVNSKRNDQVRFYGGVEMGLKNISFFNSSETEALNQYGATIGIMASPSFIGSLQGNLFFSLQATMSFGGNKAFENTTLPTNFSANTTRMMFGSEYYFNRNGKIKPFVGIEIGLTRDFYEGSVSDSSFKIDGGDPIWTPKIGLLYAINSSNDIGITFNYIPEYTNDLSFPNDDNLIIPLIVSSSYYNFALNFYF
mgnify:CR=1 FL=1|tara:strand:+ start:1692 stop:2609 length:918 start_codon:yes stop_codon:yes gene_type:complete